MDDFSDAELALINAAIEGLGDEVIEVIRAEEAHQCYLNAKRQIHAGCTV